jgi:hypothetical protein
MWALAMVCIALYVLSAMSALKMAGVLIVIWISLFAAMKGWLRSVTRNLSRPAAILYFDIPAGYFV